MISFQFLAMAALLLASPLPARAASTCVARDDLRKALAQTITAERTWSHRWGLTWGGLISAQLVAAQIISSEAKRTDLYIGALGSTAGLTTSYLIGPRILWPSSAVDLESDAPCSQLGALEHALEQAALDERFMHSWAAHIGGKVFSLSLASILGFGFHHWTQAAITTVVGFALGEWMIGTRPRTAIEALERYRSGAHTQTAPTTTMLHYGLALGPGTTQLVLGVTF